MPPFRKASCRKRSASVDRAESALFLLRGDHKLAVELQDLHRELVEAAQRGKPGPEVVEGEADPQLAELAKKPARLLEIQEGHALGDFNDELFGSETSRAQERSELIGKPGVTHLLARKVDAHVERGCLAPGPSPARQFTGRLLKSPPAQVADRAGRFGEGDELRRRDQAELGVLPAHQCLEADRVAGGGFDDRLILEVNLASVDSVRQRSLQL